MNNEERIWTLGEESEKIKRCAESFDMAAADLRNVLKEKV